MTDSDPIAMTDPSDLPRQSDPKTAWSANVPGDAGVPDGAMPDSEAEPFREEFAHTTDFAKMSGSLGGDGDAGPGGADDGPPRDVPPWSSPNYEMPGQSRSRRLVRATDKREVAGVARGLADYAGLSVTAVRWGFVFATCLGGLGLIAYIVAGILMPVEGRSDQFGDRISHGRSDRLLIIMAGVIAVVFAIFNEGSGDLVLAAALLGAGVYLWSSSRTATAPVTAGPGAPWAQPNADRFAGPYSSNTQHVGGERWTEAARVAPPTIPPTPRRRGVGLITCGVAAAAMIVTGAVSSVLVTVMVGLAVLISGLVVGLILRRRSWALALPIAALAVLLFPAQWYSTAGVPFNAGAGEIRWDANSLADANTNDRRLAAGKMTIDLTGAGSSSQRFAVGAGEIEVLVPSDVQVRLTANVGVGEIEIERPRHVAAGVHRVRMTQTIGPDDATRIITLDLRVGMGHIWVHPMSAGAA
jgi:phage shock protein PspC (stress-responsive transcriptional regulator)